MKHIHISLLLGATLTFSACSDQVELRESTSAQRSILQSNNSRAVAGRMNIKLAKSTFDQIPHATQGLSLQSAPKPLAKALHSLKAYRMERIFAAAGEFEARSKSAGLDRWYTVYFDEKVDVHGAVQLFSKMQEIETAEAVLPLAQPKPIKRLLKSTEVPNSPQPKGTSFNDPKLGAQWHYYNDGKHAKSLKGADINVFPVWEKYTTGTPNVIVGVVDGGIDVEHEDLKDNMYVNQKELNGTPGVDDDGNGFIDDIYGYNFCDGPNVVGGTILPDDGGHGTHVAGTVAAKNNNGIGVCGVAGGNGTKESGVRLMSCQIYRTKDEQGEPAKAIKYAADNGAVICQNSWGYDYEDHVTELPQLMQDAIDYFIKYAGCDNEGNQRPGSPMKGGVVIFAAGNDHREYNAYPAAYPEVVSVGATGWDLTKASYSNYGDWVTISAPGGDQTTFGVEESSILSTYPKKDGNEGYGYSDGTSMACPHVSGVAALIASYFGKPGFTNEMLKKRLTSAFLPFNPDVINKNIAGKVGRGYINAEAAFATDEGKHPNKVNELQTTVDFTSAECSWAVASDEDDGTATFYHTYISDQPLNENNLSTATHQRINAIGSRLGERLTGKFNYLRDNTTYHVAIVAIDRWGNEAPPTFSQFTTRENHKPEVKASNLPNAPFEVTSDQPQTLTLEVSDPDNHLWTAELKGTTQGLTIKQEDDKVSVMIRAILAPGNYESCVVLTDELGAVREFPFSFRISRYTAPQLTSRFSNIVMGLDEDAQSITLTEHYQFATNAHANFSAQSTQGNVASAVVDEAGTLTVKALKSGVTQIRITASDGKNSTDEGSFQVRVVPKKNAPVYAVYPIPVKRDINALLNSELTEATMVVTSTTGEEFLSKTVQANEQNVATLDLSKLLPGTYQLTIITAKGKHQQMFIKR